eukprot:TRINITY_DN4603_c0_g1_i1.p1 TRINITY_DN4603_c0_g1~~TRINITY_DN4603_c0_g1_i1.p1  ORF type:complete len:460 (+),score=83.09 TRINITY_DN4603_c0_g1_i1:3-1382(+)
MKVYLHTLSKRGVIITLFVFALLYTGSIFVGHVGPTPLSKSDSISITSLESWSGEVTQLSRLHQSLTLALSLPKRVDLGFDMTLNYTMSVEGSSQLLTALPMNTTVETYDVPWELVEDSVEYSRGVSCVSGSETCKTLIIAHEPFIKFSSYRFNLTFSPFADAVRESGDGTFTFSYVNEDFTLFELWTRLGFLLFSSGVAFLYFFRLRYFPRRSWSLEQKWVAALLIGLIINNNPLFPLTIIIAHWFPVLLHQSTFLLFLGILLLFWLVSFDGIQKERDPSFFRVGSCLSFYLPKFALVVTLCGAALGVIMFIELEELDDPGASLSSEPWFNTFWVSMLVLFILYTLYLIFLVVRAAVKRNSIAFLQRRLLFLGLYTIIIVFIVVISVMVNIFTSLLNTGATQFFSIMCLFNIYVATVAVVYLPASATYAAQSPENLAESSHSASMTRFDLDIELSDDE